MRLYVDASALVKLVIHEDGGEQAREIWREADRVISAATLSVELTSALARRLRGRSLERAKTHVQTLLRGIELREIDRELLETAGTAAEAFRLGALDAIHFAAARGIDDPQLVVATWDRELSRAATAASLTVFPSPAA